jgi:hypothetical protein
MKVLRLLSLLILFTATGCERHDDIPCTTEARAGIVVIVTDRATNTPLTDSVTISISDATGYNEPLQNHGNGFYYGAYERRGNYSLSVSRPGYQAYNASNILVEADDCHVITKNVEVKLLR